VKPKVYFGWDLDTFDPNYQEGSVSNTVPELALYLETIKYILKEDSESKINIKGYTDGSGKEDYNKDLSKRRVDAVKEHIFGKVSNTVSEARIKTALYEGESLATNENKDETLRFVSIEIISSHDYIFFKGGEITKTPAGPKPNSSNNDKFIVLENTTVIPAPAIIKFTYGGDDIIIKDTTLTTAIDESAKLSSKSLIEGFHHEKVGEISYLLHEESSLCRT